MYWSSRSVESPTYTDESHALIESGDLDARRRSSSFEGGEEEKETSQQPRRWPERFSEWRTQLSGVLLSDTKPLPHSEPFLQRAGGLLHALIIFMLPSFLMTGTQRQQHTAGGSGTGGISRTRGAKPSNPTAYFDGLRGVAALVVYVFHFGYLWFPWLRDGYGAPGSDDSLWQLSLVRALHSGRSSVTLFFVLSGYVVTAKTVVLIHRRQPEQVLQSLSGSLFRRPFRLYLPIVVATLAILVLIRLDAFPPGAPYAPPRVGSTFGEQLSHWYEHTVIIVNPFRSITGRVGLYSPPYDGHLWTIPIEFKGSLMVFSILLALGRTRRWLRLTAEVVMGCWLIQLGDFDQALFCAGLFLAELALIAPPEDSSSSSTSSQNLPPLSSPPQYRQKGLSRSARHAWTIALFVLALHLLSYPESKGPDTPGFRTLSRHVPAFYAGGEERIQQFWISVGAILFVVALMYSPPVSSMPGAAGIAAATNTIKSSVRSAIRHAGTALCSGFSPASLSPSSAATGDDDDDRSLGRREPLLQRPFTTAFAQYLGRVSYALYLAHGSVNAAVCGRWLNPALEAWTDDQQSANAVLQGGSGGDTILGTGISNAEAAYEALLARARLRYCAQAACAALINTLVLLWVSDVFWRAVDARAVRVTRRLWAWASNTSSVPSSSSSSSTAEVGSGVCRR